MVQSMGLATDADVGWITSATAYLRDGLSQGSLVGAVVEDEHGRLVSCGVIEFKQRVPSPWNPSGTYAYISSMSTEPTWRRRGCARVILDELLLEARRRGVQRVELHATAEGAPLYRSVGFISPVGGEEMRLELGPRR
jgi:GNAT superfamily N-acetyltransferase